MNKNLLKLLSLILFCSLMISPLFSENSKQISQKDIDLQNKLSDPKSFKSASESMEEWAENALKHFGFTHFGENNGKIILFGKQAVSLKPSDPQYGDAFVNAYDKCIMNIQRDFLLSRFGNVVSEKTKEFYSDRSTNANEIKLPEDYRTPNFLNKILLIFDKSLDVAEKKLDKELIKLGVDPSQIKKLTPKKKKILFKDKFIKKVIEKVSGEISGLFPIQTNVVIDKKGNTQIGVIAIWSWKTQQIARDISLQRKPLIKGRGRDIYSLLPQKPEDFLATLGVRLVYDENGIPAILSYGISSYRPNTGDDYINQQLEQEAYEDAKSNADAQIAEVINGYMNYKVMRKRGEEITRFVERELKPDSETIEKTIKNIIKITNEIAKSSARASLQGISTIKRWHYKNKYGVRFVGVVRLWKYSTLKAIKNLNKPPARKKSLKGNKKSNKNYYEFNKSSKPVNTIDDF